MFRTLGLRHVIIVNSRSEVVGIIARAELLENHLQKCLGGTRSKEKNLDKKTFGHLSQVEMIAYDDDTSDFDRLVVDSPPERERFLAVDIEGVTLRNGSNSYSINRLDGSAVAKVKSENDIFFGDVDDSDL